MKWNHSIPKNVQELADEHGEGVFVVAWRHPKLGRHEYVLRAQLSDLKLLQRWVMRFLKRTNNRMGTGRRSK